ncbi:MAG: F0F1 ATP synthase subunit gamma [Cupriavidus sp.]|nr:F0F1 ATP synthase subunit gamma [Cupriavidus sp.]
MSNQEAFRKRAALLTELHEIVQAMKNVAAAELLRLTRERQTLTQALGAVAGGLARCSEMRPLDVTPPPHTARASWLVIGAERGFCGTFNARLLQAMQALLDADPQARVLLASRRMGDHLADHLDPADGRYVIIPGCAAVEDTAAALDCWLPALEAEARDGRTIWMLHTADQGFARRRLLPVPDLAGIASEPDIQGASGPPAHYLPAPVLRAALRHQAFRLFVQAALYESLEHENRSRLTQMQLAHEHLDRLGQTLRQRQAAQRQADITNELETLTSVLAP